MGERVSVKLTHKPVVNFKLNNAYEGTFFVKHHGNIKYGFYKSFILPQKENQDIFAE